MSPIHFHSCASLEDRQYVHTMQIGLTFNVMCITFSQKVGSKQERCVVLLRLCVSLSALTMCRNEGLWHALCIRVNQTLTGLQLTSLLAPQIVLKCNHLDPRCSDEPAVKQVRPRGRGLGRTRRGMSWRERKREKKRERVTEKDRELEIKEGVIPVNCGQTDSVIDRHPLQGFCCCVFNEKMDAPHRTLCCGSKVAHLW